ncbi:MAG TPA: hypothetical protein VGM82_15215 [Gemmatimonadaceae bacterium]|jgi:hypothetical protein
MPAAAGTGCLLRATLVMFGFLFLPMAVWFAYRGFSRYWLESLALLMVGLLFLRLGLSKKDNSWLSLIDDLEQSKK